MHPDHSVGAPTTTVARVLGAVQKIGRPRLGPLALNAGVATFIMAACNRTFWSVGADIFAGNALDLVVFGGAIWGLTLLIVSLFGPGRLQKPVLVFMLILSAITSYYMDTFGTVIDREMIQNAMTTTVTEAKHLVTRDFLIHVVLFGVLPALVVLWVQIVRRGPVRTAAAWVGTVAMAFALFVGLLLTDFKTYSAVLREQKQLAMSYQPGAPLSGTFRYVKMVMRSQNTEVAALGLDAVKGPIAVSGRKPMLTVLVAGETARAQSFGLNGYERDTTPELAARNVINFSDVSSCGTATAVSLPCMFSNFTRSNYSHERGLATENLLDVLHHAGVAVQWWDNNTGDKGIAARVEMTSVTNSADPVFCAKGECEDAIFLDRLDQLAATITEDTVVVIHQIGSHGPAYYLRYPEGFEPFAPACQSAEFAKCSVEEIRNAYDNTIAYTDRVLGQMIDILAASDRVDGALLYISDHGESLGEGGLFLHGAPYFVAPETQTQVPMVMWLSQDFKKASAIDEACIRARAEQPLSQDNLFHTVLGLMDIRTSVRDEELNLLAGCRPDAERESLAQIRN
jgi:lipid A ethanolaminephosphotransferase